MLSKLLQNKFAMMVLAIILVAGAIGIYKFIIDSDDNPDPPPPITVDTPCDSLTTPDYCVLLNEIRDYSKGEWNKSAYNAIRSNIIQYAADGTDLIEEDQKDALLALLNSKNLDLLSRASQVFCRTATGADMKRLGELEAGLLDAQTTETAIVKNTQSLLSSFRNAINLQGSVKNYAYRNAFSSVNTDSYNGRINSTLQTAYLTENTYIQRIMRESRETLTIHRGKDELFNALDDAHLREFDCSRFSPYSYYETACRRRREQLPTQ